MGLEPDTRGPGAALAATLLTGLLAYLGTGLEPRWPLVWLAPLPVLVLSLRAPGPVSALAATLGWGLGGLSLASDLHGVLHLPAPALVATIAGPALAFAAAVLLFRALFRRGTRMLALFAFPAAWVSFEYLVNLTSPHGSAASLAYTQLGFLAFLQLASVTGPWGLSFLLLLFPAALALGFRLRREAPRQARVLAGAGLGLVATALAWGALRLARPTPGPIVSVGLVASDPPTSPSVADEGAPMQRLLDAYSGMALRLVAAGAQVVVMPEKLGVLADAQVGAADRTLQAVADDTGATVVAGVIRVAPSARYNEARVYRPGAAPLQYHKQHMLPPFETGFEPGAELVRMAGRAGVLGVAICKDMDFAAPARDYARSGVGLLLVPAWDFGLDRLRHGHLAIMRGVEGGFAIARAARDGYLTVSDSRGRVVAETRSDAAPFATLHAKVAAGHVATPYLVVGDWCAWLSLLLLAAVPLRLLGGPRAPGAAG